MVTLSVFRYRPKSGYPPSFQEYEIPYRPDMVVLDALNYVKDNLDGSLTFRWSCRMGICGSCGTMVDGKPRLTCATFLKELIRADKVVRIEPLAYFPVIKDLVIDMSDFMEKLRKIQPWIVRDEKKSPEEGEYLQTPEQVEAYGQQSMCINCMLCYAACPIYGLDPEFIGPAASALAYRYVMDSRNEGAKEKFGLVTDKSGVWNCTFVGQCTAVCPKNVDPAFAIQRLKVLGATEAVKSILMPGLK